MVTKDVQHHNGQVVSAVVMDWDTFYGPGVPTAPTGPPSAQAVQQAASTMDTPPYNTPPEKLAKAVELVLGGKVRLHPGGAWAVQGSKEQPYQGNGTCPCPQGQSQRSKWCKHLVAVELAKRAQPLPPVAPATWVEQAKAQPAIGPQPAPGSSIPPQFLVELHGKQFVQYAGLLALAHERGLTQLSANFISVTETLALAEATAEFADGRTFMECADSTPQNVGPTVKAHFPRIALTRAKARALRDALNIAMVAVEELEG